MLSSDSAPLWSAPRDAQLRRLLLDGADWEEVGAALAMTADAARRRARHIGAAGPPEGAGAARRNDPFRPPLSPGHPRSWGLLTAGTLLSGLPWPSWI